MHMLFPVCLKVLLLPESNHLSVFLLIRFLPEGLRFFRLILQLKLWHRLFEFLNFVLFFRLQMLNLLFGFSFVRLTLCLLRPVGSLWFRPLWSAQQFATPFLQLVILSRPIDFLLISFYRCTPQTISLVFLLRRICLRCPAAPASPLYTSNWFTKAIGALSKAIGVNSESHSYSINLFLVHFIVWIQES